MSPSSIPSRRAALACITGGYHIRGISEVSGVSPYQGYRIRGISGDVGRGTPTHYRGTSRIRNSPPP